VFGLHRSGDNMSLLNSALVRVNCSTLNHDSVTCSRSPSKFDRPPRATLDLRLPPVPLMNVACDHWPFARQRRLLSSLVIGSRVCSTLLSGLASRLHPLRFRYHFTIRL